MGPPLSFFLAVFAGYAVSLGTWFVLTRRRQQLWVAPQELRFARPGLELGLALLCAVAVFALSVAYSLGWLFPLPAGSGLGRKLAFLAALALIWSPVAIYLVVRHQGLETCLASLRGWPKKLAWGFGGALVALVVHNLVRGDLAVLEPALTAMVSWRPTAMMQSVIQFVGFGFLLTRLVAVLGPRGGLLVCGLLYGLVKYPYYTHQLGMAGPQALGMMAFSAAVACTAVYVAYDRQDVLVPAVVHVFMDMAQSA